MKNNAVCVCQWIGLGEGCVRLTPYGKSYCDDHIGRIYLNLLPEMANYIVDKEVTTIFKDME